MRFIDIILLNLTTVARVLNESLLAWLVRQEGVGGGDTVANETRSCLRQVRYYTWP